MKKFLLMAVAALTSVATWAIEKPKLNWVPMELDTEYYLFNVETASFIVGANDWGTRASVTNSGFGLKVKVTENGSTYYLNNVTDNNRFDCDGGLNSWKDGKGRQGDGQWTISEADNGTYNFFNTVAGDKKWGVDLSLSNTRTFFNDNDAAYGNSWAFFTEAPSIEDLTNYGIAMKNYKAIVSNEARAEAAGLKAEFDAEIADIVTAYEAGTLNEDKTAAIEEAYGKVVNVAIVKNAGAGADVTSVIVNPNFDGNVSGWTDTFTGSLNHGFQNNATYGPINQFMECWAGQWSGAATPYLLPNGKLYQNVYLPAGEYTLSADIIATQQQAGQAGYIASLDEVTGIYIYAQSDVLFKSDACNAVGAEPKRYEFKFNTTGGWTELGLLIENTNCNWTVMDNVRLVYEGESTINVYQEALKEALAEAIAPADLTAPAAQAVVDVYTTAYNAADDLAKDDDAADEDYAEAQANLTAAAAALTASVNEYVEIAKVNTKAEALDAAGQDVYAATKTAYDNRTIETAAEAQAAYVAAVKKQTTKGIVLEGLVPDNSMDGWTLTNGSTFHVNTWSSEGNSDGSEMKTPFIENWVAGGNFLEQDTKWAKTISGLVPGQYYAVSALIRAYNEASGDVPTGAHLYAGEGVSSDISTGTNAGTATKGMVYGTFTAIGAADSEGNLTIGIYEDLNNFNWIAAKSFTITISDKEAADAVAPVVATMSVTDAKWGTFCAPYSVALPKGVQAYTVDDVDEDGTTLVLAEVKGTVPAYTPVVVSSEAEVNQEYSFPVEETKLAVAGMLTGVLEDSEAPVGTYVLQNQAVDGVGFYQVNGAKTVKANHAYLTVPASEVKAFYFGNTTAIKALDAMTAGKAQIFDMNGRQINKLQKGINIVNGVKVLVK